jgi:hypothetical protein
MSRRSKHSQIEVVAPTEGEEEYQQHKPLFQLHVRSLSAHGQGNIYACIEKLVSETIPCLACHRDHLCGLSFSGMWKNN